LTELSFDVLIEQIGDYRNSAKATLIAVLFPLSLIYQFEPEAWTSYDTVLQLSDGAPTVDANRMGATLPVSATLVDLDGECIELPCCLCLVIRTHLSRGR
jgi:hypothetical protein